MRYRFSAWLQVYYRVFQILIDEEPLSAIRLSNRVNRIKPSPTLAVDARAKALKAQGKDVISLGAGEPDFDTPDHIKEAAIRAIRSVESPESPGGTSGE